MSGSLFLLCFLLMCGCSAGAPGLEDRGRETGGPQKESVTILVAAAASLENVLSGELIPLFEAEHPGIGVEGIYDSSGRLRSQIENVLEADLFVSAAEEEMQQLQEEKLVDQDSLRPLLENRLVLIVPAGNEKGIAHFSDISKAAYPALGDPQSVPAGRYAKEALETLGVWEEIKGRCSLGLHVTEVLGWVESGSADAGFVYATDAAVTDRVEVAAEAPEGALADRILYPAGIVSASRQKEAAAQFLDFLCTREAAAAFRAYGFTPVEQEPGLTGGVG